MPKYQGPIELNDFSGGYNSKATPEMIGKNQFAYGSLNYRLTESGGVRKRNGYAEAFTDLSSSWTTHYETLGLQEFYSPEYARALVRVARNTSTDDVRYEYNDGDLPGTVASDWNAGGSLGTVTSSEQYVDFAHLLGRLYVACPGLSQVKYISNTGAWGVTAVTVTDVSSPRSFTAPKGIEQWYNRIWAFTDSSNEGGTYIYWTDTGGSSFNLDGGDFQIIPGEGPITGIQRVGDKLFVFKRRSIWILTGGYDPDNLLQVHQLPGSGDQSIGCVARRSIVSVGNDVFFLSEKGFYHTDGYRLNHIGEAIQPDMDLLDKTLLDRSIGVHYPKNSEVVWFVPFTAGDDSGAWGITPWGTSPWGGGSTSQRGFVYDYSLMAWCAPFTNQPFRTACLLTNSTSVTSDAEDIIIVCDEDTATYGYPFIWDSGEFDGDGTTRTAANLVTPAIHMGDIGLVKIVRKIYLQLGGLGVDPANTEGYVPIKVEVFTSDYGYLAAPSAYSESTQQLTGGSDQLPLYSSTRHTVGGRGRTIKLRIGDYDDGTITGGPHIIAGVSIYISVKGHRT